VSPAKPPPQNTHGAKFGRIELCLFCVAALIVAAFVGLPVAMDVYSGPSIALGLGITALVAIVTCLLFVILPDGPRRVLCYVVGFLLQ